MKIPFTKLHGAKNDFLLTPAEAAPAEGLGEIAVEICDRYTGVGADGWMLIDRTAGPDFDASIRLFNSDGSEPELSGNGTRCAAALLADDRPGQTEFRIRTGAGIKGLRLAWRDENNFEFEMNMGEIRVISLHSPVEGRDAVLVDAGNPQCAIAVENFDFDWRTLGAAVERDPLFPNRTNVSFIRGVGEHAIEVRFWERGAGETNSSGTGSTGAAVAAVARGIVKPPVTVLTPAGPLELKMHAGSTPASSTVYLTGPVSKVAEGVFHRAKMKR
ncbi:MAG TPA: diaminopimelate epimerase [Bryobacteraceae bacterium]|nr:diaminopimelate epimerase [Bryobacteraceae bacterium]